MINNKFWKYLVNRWRLVKTLNFSKMDLLNCFFETFSYYKLVNIGQDIEHLQDISVFIFHCITMLMACVRLGGIGEFPPHPSRFRQCHIVPRLRLGTTEALPQPLRIRREFSNTSSPSSRHCIITSFNSHLITK